MNEMKQVRLLLVEDDASLGFVIKDNLEQQGIEVILATDGEEAKQLFAPTSIDICILDVMLPKVDGFTLAEHIRKLDQEIPIIFLTAKSMKEDRIKGFKLGADDYMVKPFNIEELILRIQVFLKRSGKQHVQQQYQIGAFTFNLDNLELTTDTSVKQLTRREAELLKLLVDQKENMVARTIILRQIWGSDDYFAGRSMDVFISKLRKYLAADQRIEIINHHGIGFKLSVKK